MCTFALNPDDLSCVRVYGTDDKFLMEVPQSLMEANYNDNQEKIGRIMAYKRRAERDLQKFADALTLEDKDPERALNLVREHCFPQCIGVGTVSELETCGTSICPRRTFA